MWSKITVGECVLLECPSRWYAGIVAERSSVTVLLRPALCLHSISDLGRFLSGELAAGTEATPLADIEINLGIVDSAQALPVEKFPAMCQRTHK